jgi:hypothetical protein
VIQLAAADKSIFPWLPHTIMAEAELLQAKALLLQAGPSGLNLYDHLSEIIAKVLDERPQNAAETLEDISRAVKATRFHHKGSNLQVRPKPACDSSQLLSQIHLPSFSPSFPVPAPPLSDGVHRTCPRFRAM